MKASHDRSANVEESQFSVGDLVVFTQLTPKKGESLKLLACRDPAVVKAVKYPNLTIRVRESGVVVDRTVHVEQVRKFSGELEDEELLDFSCGVCEKYHPQGLGRRAVQWIQCDKCAAWFHQACVEIPHRFDFDKDSWLCKGCS